MFLNRLVWLSVSLILAACHSVASSANANVWQLGDLLSQAKNSTTNGSEVQIEGQPIQRHSPFGPSAHFDGDGDRLLVQNNPLFGAKEFTVEAIIYPEDVYPANTEPRFLHIESAENPNRRVTMELRLTATKQWYFDAYIKSDINSHTLVDKNLLHPVGQWAHVAITYRNGKFSSYVNGKLELSAEVQYQAIAKQAATSLGARMNRIHWFNGQIAQVAFSHQALSPEYFTLLPLISNQSNKGQAFNMTADDLITQLRLEAHPLEGGYFRRIYETNAQVTTEYGSRLLASSIHYLLTAERNLGYLHKNRSDILHFYQHGSPVRYHLLFANGDYQQVTLGPDINQHQLQLTVPGGVWKASELLEGNYGLVSEVVIPGFDYADNTLAKASDLKAFPTSVQQQLQRFLAP